jgi:hypothetical protein
VTYRYCHRCQADLPAHDEGTLVFCSACGAPQIFLSEDLQTQVETQTKLAADTLAAGPLARDPHTLVWAGALRCVGLAALVAAGLMFASLLLPPSIFLVCFWAVISPVVVIGLFQARNPTMPMSTSLGARLGFVTGLAVALTLSTINAITLVVARFGLHAMGDWDKQMAVGFEQLRTQAALQPGAPALGMISTLAIPEFRAGFLLVGGLMMAVILMAITTVGGTFAGFVRSRSRL